MATKTSQRVFIWVIAAVMVIGTLAGFFAMIITPKNEAADQAKIQEATAKYQKEMAAFQVKMTQQGKEMSERYFDKFSGFKPKVGKFDKPTSKDVKAEDLVAGEGDTLGDKSRYAVYYMGWNPEGKMFDSSFNDDKSALNRPLVRQADGMWDFGNGQPGNVIEGWTEGLKDVKLGTVRVLTIPSDKAYGEAGGGENIPANTPLKFLMMIVEAPEEVKAPKIPEILLQNYQ
jgi:FKBP-type peptidyl-prolyl cis-trans isomerase